MILDVYNWGFGVIRFSTMFWKISFTCFYLNNFVFYSSVYNCYSYFHGSLKRLHWTLFSDTGIRYVDDSFIIWPHARYIPNEFLARINSQHFDIKFTLVIFFCFLLYWLLDCLVIVLVHFIRNLTILSHNGIIILFKLSLIDDPVIIFLSHIESFWQELEQVS